MTTTAHEDQFTAEPEPVRQPYDTGSILRRNVADLEIALKQQTERAEAAEKGLAKKQAILAKLREQKPVLYVSFSDSETMRFWSTEKPKKSRYPIKEFYAAPAPVPAPAVPAVHEIAAQLLIAETEMLNAKAWAVGKQSRVHIGFAMTAIGCARALLQSAAVKDSLTAAPDCLACANRGLVNGLSQEFYCDSCIYQGRSWRKNHFVLAVKRRCEACAILPCSCK